MTEARSGHVPGRASCNFHSPLRSFFCYLAGQPPVVIVPSGDKERRVRFQRHPNPRALRSAQRRELKSVLCSQCASNFRRDHLFVGVRQRDFERNQLAQYQSLSNERP